MLSHRVLLALSHRRRTIQFVVLSHRDSLREATKRSKPTHRDVIHSNRPQPIEVQGQEEKSTDSFHSPMFSMLCFGAKHD